MANIILREPREIMSLRDAMDQLFDESFLRPFGPFGNGGAYPTQPALDVYETDKDLVVTATIPGVKPDDLKISLTGDVLELSGQMAAETRHKDANYYLRERRTGSFSRVLTLPVPVVGDKAKAEFEHGVLTLTLPKAAEARRKTIAIKTKK